MSQVILKSGHVQPVWAGHPWIFQQGIEKIRGKIEHGDEVEVVDAKGNAMGRGLYSKGSAIAIRLFSTDPEKRLNRTLIEERLTRALDRRRAFQLPGKNDGNTNGFRAFHSEGDGLPGLIVDCFDDVLVFALGTAGMARRREAIVEALQNVFKPRSIVERTTSKAQEAENFEATNGVVRGEAIEEMVVQERGLTYRLPLDWSQKTGFYFDQRPLRARVEALSAGKTVLDAYSFIGPIGLSAKRGGATRVVCVDSSAPAVEMGKKIAEENQLEVEFEKAKALDFLARQKEASWDVVIVDPPKLAQSRGARDRAMKAFRKIAAAAVRATASGGTVVLSSCSAAIGIADVERCLALGARDAERKATVMERVFQGADHPVPPAFPQGLYLSTAIAYVD